MGTASGEARARYLDIALGIAVAPASATSNAPRAVAGVAPEAIATAAGVARTTLYRHWPSLEDLWVDLCRHILHEETPTSILPASGPPDGSEGFEWTRRTLNAAERRFALDPWIALRAAVLTFPDHPAIAAVLRDATVRMLESLRADVAVLLDAVGRVPSPPTDDGDLAAALFAVIDGIATAAHATPTVADRPITVAETGDRPWGLLAYGWYCLLQHRTQPGGSARTVAGDPAPARPPGPLFGGERLRLLQAAARLHHASEDATDEPILDFSRGPLSHVTVARVARAAGVSRQAVQRIWPSQLALSADLVRHISERESRDVGRVMRDASKVGLVRATDMVLAATEFAMRRFASLATTSPERLLMYSSPHREPAIRDATRAGLERVLQQWAADTALITAAGRRRLQPGVDAFDVGTLILLTEAATGRLMRTNPDAVRRGLSYRGGNWSSVALTIHSFVTTSIDPSSAPPPSPR